MNQIDYNSRWVVPYKYKGPYIFIQGWFPMSFDWDIQTLYNRQTQLRKVKIIYDVPSGFNGASSPEVIFNNLPVPLISMDNYVIETLSSYFDGFMTIPIQMGIKKNNRFDKYPYKRIVLVPKPEVFFLTSNEVPSGRHFAVIGNRFCISMELIQKHAFYFRSIIFTHYNDSLILPPSATIDYSDIFIKREKANVAIVVERIFNFILENLSRYSLLYNEQLGAILLDCDPNSPYVIIALKQTPIDVERHLDTIEINDFELDQFAIIRAKELYGETEYLSATNFMANWSNK